MNKLSLFQSQTAPDRKFGDLRVGWTIKIHQKLKEGEKAKNQTFEGIIIARKHGNEPGATITVRKMSGGIGVEKIIPLQLPSIERIEVLRKSRVRRAKLYYLRDKTSKEIRKKTKQEVIRASQNIQAEAAPVAEA
ncbi:MAG: 50S ribosomal protein L19 [Candidatus Yanofskybacteria bacterium]|nr:50S ribosomal protein L19 [Candidatus Yanofskybacteria bacterium]